MKDDLVAGLVLTSLLVGTCAFCCFLVGCFIACLVGHHTETEFTRIDESSSRKVFPEPYVLGIPSPPLPLGRRGEVV